MRQMRRFRVGNSRIWGWHVYDSDRQCAPAWEACGELLPRIDEEMSESPVNFMTYSSALKLCNRLNIAWRKLKFTERGQENEL